MISSRPILAAAEALTDSAAERDESVVVGVLAIQGAFLEHLSILRSLGVRAVEVRRPADLDGCDGLVLPGGESTAMSLIAQRDGLWEPLKAFVHGDRPVWGTCAGMILLADRATGTCKGGQALLGGVDVEVHRNFFGSQLASFEADVHVLPAFAAELASADPVHAGGKGTDEGAGSAVADKLDLKLPGVFIRAPAILRVGPAAEAIAVVRHRGVEAGATEDATVVVAARQGHFLVTAFHPELTKCRTWHAHFVRMVREAAEKRVSRPATEELSEGASGGGAGGSDTGVA